MRQEQQIFGKKKKNQTSLCKPLFLKHRHANVQDNTHTQTHIHTQMYSTGTCTLHH